MAPAQYELVRDGEEIILQVNLTQSLDTPTVEDDSKTMSRIVGYLQEVRVATKIIISQFRDYEYDYEQTQMLVELAKMQTALSSHKLIFPEAQGEQVNAHTIKLVNNQYVQVQQIIIQKLKGDPFGAYVDLKRILRHSHLKLKESYDPRIQHVLEQFVQTIQHILQQLDQLTLIKLARPYLPGYDDSNRDLYRQFLSPTIRPDFMLTRLMSSYPKNAKEIDSFIIGEDTEVTIFQTEDNIQYLYHIMPPEFKLSDDLYALLDEARNVLADHKPQKEEFTDPARIREVFFNVGTDLISELAKKKGIALSKKDLRVLTKILVRYTVGFGLIEVLLSDEDMQDISVNSPQGSTPIYIVHGKYDECVTNILPTKGETESWATKLRLISGRSLDEADPILDTELEFDTASVRVSAITYPLDPTGLAFSFRRHRNKPWTLPLFITNRTINSMAAGLLSFLIDGSRAMLIAGTRSSGKSSILSAVMVEIMRRYRMITIEDSVTGDSVIQYKEDDFFYRGEIEGLFTLLSKNHNIRLENGREIIDLSSSKVLSLNSDYNSSYESTNALIRHKVDKQIYEIITKTGRILKLTCDHSLFVLGDDVLEEIKTDKLSIGQRIGVTKKNSIIKSNSKLYNLFETYIKQNKTDVYVRCDVTGINSLSQHQKKTGVISYELSKKHNLCPIEFKVGSNSSSWIPVTLAHSELLYEALGLWLADGCFDHNSLIFSVSSVEEKNVVKQFANLFNLSVKQHSDKFSLMIHSKSLKFAFKYGFGLKGDAYTKRIPTWIFALSKKYKSAFLRGFFSGDGCASDKEVICSLSNLGLLDDLQSLLLEYGIISRINRLRERKPKENDRTKDLRISSLEGIKLFRKEIGFLQSYKNKKLAALCSRKSTHQSSGGVILPRIILRRLKLLCPRDIFNDHDYIVRKNAIGLKKLKKIASFVKKKDDNLAKYLYSVSNSDIYWDEVIKIRKLPVKKQYVYDFSVPGSELFIANNICAHNTLELPTKQLRQLGFNIQPMKVASALGSKSNEMDASDGIRSTLRLGDSALFVGEVRSSEAKALYEAMRVGAAANVVAGTIHGDSPYGIFDRVVNDIGVPKTSFKATDIIIIANPIRSADGLHKYRRVLSITEVRKDWDNDPQTEGGFVDLMKYNPETDELEPTDALIGGDSDVLKEIAGKIKEFAGNWDAVWNNILLRAKCKEELVKISKEMQMEELLEAPFVIACNDEFHRLFESIKSSGKTSDLNEFNERLFYDWKTWLVREVRKKKNG